MMFCQLSVSFLLLLESFQGLERQISMIFDSFVFVAFRRFLIFACFELSSFAGVALHRIQRAPVCACGCSGGSGGCPSFPKRAHRYVGRPVSLSVIVCLRFSSNCVVFCC